jgi:hypothetical protein
MTDYNRPTDRVTITPVDIISGANLLTTTVQGVDQDGNFNYLPLSDNGVPISGAKYSLQGYFESTDGWTTSTAISNFATSTQHRGSGENSLEFDKINGATTITISRTVPSFDMDQYSTHAIGIMNVYISTLTNVAYCFARIGTDDSNHCEWDFSSDLLTNGWNQLQENICEPTIQSGNGYNLSAITYIAFGVVFNNATDVLTDIRTCAWGVKRVLETATVINADVAIDTAWVGIKDQNSNTRCDVEGGTYKHLYTRQTDGTNRMPMGDADARAISVNLGANNDVSINAGTNLIGIISHTGYMITSFNNSAITINSVSNVATVNVIPNQYILAGVTSHVNKYYTNTTATTDGIVWSPASGKRWYATDLYINVSVPAVVTLEDDKTAGDNVVWKGNFAANSGWSHSFTTPLFSGENTADLIITTDTGPFYMLVTGYEV